MYKQKDVAGIFLTFTLKAIIECDYASLYITGMAGTGKTYCSISKMISMFLELLEREQTSPGTESYKIKDIIIIFHMSEKTLCFVKDIFL